MENKKAIELIKLEVLGCLNAQDRLNLKRMKETDENFPWKQLSQYQLLAAQLPSVLEIKFPASELKDKTAMKLYNIRDEIKAKIEAKKSTEVSQDRVDEELIILEEKPEVSEKFSSEEIIEENIEENVLVEFEEAAHAKAENYSSEHKEPFRIQSNFNEKTLAESLLHEVEDKQQIAPKVLPDKEQIEKVTRDYINSYFEIELETLRNKIKKTSMLSIILFIITLALIAGVYLSR